MSDNEREIHEKAKQYIGYLLKAVDFADDVLVRAHDVVATLGEVANEAVDFAQDALFSASVKLDEYRDFVNSNVEEGERRVHGENTPNEEAVQDKIKPIKPTADMSRAEKIDFIIQGYGLDDTSDQRQVLNASSDQALTQAVNVIRQRNSQ